MKNNLIRIEHALQMPFIQKLPFNFIKTSGKSENSAHVENIYSSFPGSMLVQ